MIRDDTFSWSKIFFKVPGHSWYLSQPNNRRWCIFLKKEIALFCCEFAHFLVYTLQALIKWQCTKMDKYQVCPWYIKLLFCSVTVAWYIRDHGNIPCLFCIWADCYRSSALQTRPTPIYIELEAEPCSVSSFYWLFYWEEAPPCLSTHLHTSYGRRQLVGSINKGKH